MKKGKASYMSKGPKRLKFGAVKPGVDPKKKPRKKAMLGALAGPVAGLAAGAMQKSDNPTMQKIGKGLGMANKVAGVVGGGPSAGPPAAAKKGMMKKKAGDFKSKGKKFPDLTGDGKVTQADILKGRGVIKKGKNGMMKYKEGDMTSPNVKEKKKVTKPKSPFLVEKTTSDLLKGLEKDSAKVTKRAARKEAKAKKKAARGQGPSGPAVGSLFGKGGMKDRRKRSKR